MLWCDSLHLLRARKERRWPQRAAGTGVSQTPRAWGERALCLPSSTRGWGASQDGEHGWSRQGISAGWTLVPFGAASLACPPLFLPFSDQVFEELIHRPSDGCGGDLVNDSSLHPSEVGSHPAYLIHRPEGTSHACDMSCKVWVQSQGFLGVEQCFANVQWGCGSGSYSSCTGSGEDVGAGVVPSLGVKVLLQEFVGHEVNGLEGNVHGELGGVAAVKGPSPFVLPHCPDTVCHPVVRWVVHLHPLLDHWRRHQWEGNGDSIQPVSSNVQEQSPQSVDQPMDWREKKVCELSVGLLSESFPFLRGGDSRGLIKG